MRKMRFRHMARSSLVMRVGGDLRKFGMELAKGLGWFEVTREDEEISSTVEPAGIAVLARSVRPSRVIFP